MGAMNIKHGTQRGYQNGCRCDKCKAVRSAYYSDYNKREDQRKKHNEYQKAYHAKRTATDPDYREWYRAKSRASARRLRATEEGRKKDNARACEQTRARRNMVQEYKLAKGCADCGYKGHPEALEFDHIDSSTKVANVSRIRGLSLETLQAEMDKCEVVCANCHRIRTYNRRHKIASDHNGKLSMAR